MRTSESGAPVLRRSSEPKRIQRPPKPPGVKPPPEGQRWSGSLEELAARQRAAQERAAAKPAAGAPQPSLPRSAAEWRLPAAAPGSVKTRLSALYRNQTCDRTWQVPCWLASLLLHLLAVVLLGSLTVPVSRNRTVVSLLLTFGDLTAPANDEPVELAAAVLEPATEPMHEDEGGNDLSGFEAPPPLEPGISAELPLPRDRSETPDPDESTNAAGALPGEAPPGQADARGGNTPKLALDAAADADDDVVERFIQFDIGKLLGEAGAKAREDFQRLGPQALPSLVRGLNRSASIHASCPVMVITSKIEAMLSENKDPELLKYAIDNIGRGVPTNAPHRGRLRSLLTRLRGGPPSSSPNVTWVAAQLESHDRQQIVTAAETVAAKCTAYTEMDKRDIAWEFIRLLHDRYPNVRAAAHKTLVALAEGEDFGPDDDRQAAERFAAAGEWSRHFDAERFEAAAVAALKNGEHLEKAGKRPAARRQYQKVAQEYPGTAAADDAARHLETAKSFAFK
jgi:hypothetical protein